MSLFPFTTPITQPNTTVSPSSVREYGINFTTGKMTGKIVEGVEAICVWVYLTLKARRYRWVIYSWNYGEECTNLIGYSYSEEFIKSEAQRYLEEALFQNEHIKAIENLTASIVDDTLYLKFNLITDVGDKEVAMYV